MTFSNPTASTLYYWTVWRVSMYVTSSTPLLWKHVTSGFSAVAATHFGVFWYSPGRRSSFADSLYSCPVKSSFGTPKRFSRLRSAGTQIISALRLFVRRRMEAGSLKFYHCGRRGLIEMREGCRLSTNRICYESAFLIIIFISGGILVTVMFFPYSLSGLFECCCCDAHFRIWSLRRSSFPSGTVFLIRRLKVSLPLCAKFSREEYYR